MNGNRMKYASTPTYGMQKRSFLKKSAPVHHAPDAPDFSKAPGAVNGMPFQPSIPQPAASQPTFMQQPAAPQQPYAPAAPYYTQVPAAPMQPSAQVPFAAPTFVPPVSGMPLPPQTMGMQPPPSQQMPLGNTLSGFTPSASFSTRGQGFVPPQPATAPNVQPAAVKAQPAAMQPFGAQQPMAASPFSQAAPMGYAPVQPQMPVFQNPAAMQPDPQQPAFSAQPMMQQPAFAARQPETLAAALTFDRLWSVFLFGLLPLLFIPCIFVPGSWDFLRYAFLALTVVGLGVMWYRQMYASSTRLIVSMVYVALAIAAVAMLMQGGNDVRRASADLSHPAAQQQTLAPDSELSTTPEPLPQETPVPVPIGPSEAERRLELFMSLWQMNNTTEMVSLVQPSWCSKQENPSQALFNVLKNRTPEDYTIEDISGTETDNSRTVTMRATINKNTGKAPVVYRFMVMMVKEGNEWYVNPNSLATNDEVETTDENVVNNRNAVGNVTEPQRTTVTPAPPASTLLYYNEGANYYHMDPNCASVKTEYLPFDFSFSYGDLKSVMREFNLSPCLKCNAPTNTLD